MNNETTDEGFYYCNICRTAFDKLEYFEAHERSFHGEHNNELPCGYEEPSTVDHPSHYKQGDIECIDAIRSALTAEEFRGFCKGNVIKYTWRERMKEQDKALAKAKWYIEKLIGMGE